MTPTHAFQGVLLWTVKLNRSASLILQRALSGILRMNSPRSVHHVSPHLIMSLDIQQGQLANIKASPNNNLHLLGRCGVPDQNLFYIS